MGIRVSRWGCKSSETSLVAVFTASFSLELSYVRKRVCSGVAWFINMVDILPAGTFCLLGLISEFLSLLSFWASVNCL